MDVERSETSNTVWRALSVIYGCLSPLRRIHLKATIGLMMVGALTELVTISAVIPFLALLADPARFERISVLGIKVQDIMPAQGGDLTGIAAGILISAATASGALRLLLAWVSQRLVFSISRDLGDQVFRNVLRQPYRYHIRRSSSEIISGMDKVQHIAFAALLPGVQALISSVIAVLLVALLFFIEPVVTLIAAATFTSLYLLVGLTTRSLLNQNSAAVSERNLDRIRLVQLGIGGIRDILLSRSEGVLGANFHRIGSELKNAQTMNTFISSAPRILIEVIGVALLALLAWRMSSDQGGLAATIPILGAMALGAQRLLPLLQAAFFGWSQFVGNTRSITDVAELLMLPVEEDGRGAAPIDVFDEAIVFERVNFEYEPGRPALHDISFEVTKGQRIGIVGKTGSGKSTLMDIFLGLLEPTRGTISIDGKVMDAELRRSWQAQIAHVPQAIYLAESSIAANIAFGEQPESVDPDRVREAARIAGIDEFIMSLPAGYSTHCGERGIRLSGGQRQRIGIARALYKHSKVLVFDEATSALDSDTEAAVMEALSRLGSDVTVLLIAHRVSTLAGCDKILRLADGQLVDELTYKELMAAAN